MTGFTAIATELLSKRFERLSELFKVRTSPLLVTHQRHKLFPEYQYSGLRHRRPRAKVDPPPHLHLSRPGDDGI